MQTSSLGQVSCVVMPVTDQARALDFYTGVLGGTITADFPAEPGFRWLEVRFGDGPTSIALVVPRGGMWGAPGGDSRVIIGTPNLDDAHARLSDAGAEVDAEVLRLGPGVPAMFRFRDPDGNELQVIESHSQ